MHLISRSWLTVHWTDPSPYGQPVSYGYHAEHHVSCSNKTHWHLWPLPAWKGYKWWIEVGVHTHRWLSGGCVDKRSGKRETLMFLKGNRLMAHWLSRYIVSCTCMCRGHVMRGGEHMLIQHIWIKPSILSFLLLYFSIILVLSTRDWGLFIHSHYCLPFANAPYRIHSFILLLQVGILLYSS